MSQFSIEDMVFSKKNGEITAGGFLLNTIFSEKSPIMTINTNKDKSKNENKVSSILKDLAIPVGLFSMPSNSACNFNEIDAGVIEDDLHDKLLNNLQADQNSFIKETKVYKSKKNKINKKQEKKKTRKQKNK